jgi:hydroxypyruvate reductase
MREDARAIFAAGVAGADPRQAVARSVRRAGETLSVAGRDYDLRRCRNVYVLGGGKGGAPMVLAVEDLLGRRITGGLVAVKYGYRLPCRRVEIVEAGHPLPDAAGMAAARRILRFAEGAGRDDLVMVLISGGASALLACPAQGLDLEDKQVTTGLLLKSGATIEETNTVRKHLSLIKGGRLAKSAAPAAVLGLIISDVVGDRIDVVGSGPTAADPSTFADCLRVLGAYGLITQVPAAVVDLLERGARHQLSETPEPGDPVFARVHNVVVANNESALAAAHRKACALGYNAMILSSSVRGDTTEAAVSHALLGRRILDGNGPTGRPACVLSGGETTVVVRGRGRGGRNQEFGLAAAIELDAVEAVVLLSGGTDGTDGPTDAAGSLVDGGTIRRGRSRGLDAERCLAANDSYHFLEATGDLLVTGPTYTNVMDLHVMLIA